MKTTLKIAIVAVIVWVIFMFVGNYNTGIQIEDTPAFVKEVKKISQLATLKQVGDIVINDTLRNRVHEKSVWFWKWDDTTEQKYWLVQIGTVKIKAGFDLEKINEDDVKVDGGELRLVFPHAEILEVELNPEDIQPYYEEKIEGDWDDEKMVQQKKSEMYAKYKDIAKQKAIDSGILDKATALCEERLYKIFSALGFSKVTIEYKE